MTSHYEVPIERVFELATDYKRYPEWSVSYAEVDKISGPPEQVGTKFHTFMKVLGRRIEGSMEVVEVEKPRLLKLSGTGIEGGKLTMLYRLMPAGTGTDFEIEADYELPAKILGQIADKLFVERSVERDLRHSIENFKELVEAKVPVLV
jgi:uncharacterized membrane protein